MHETMIAESIADTIAKQAEKLGAKPVKAKISCGQLNPINDEVMNFAFEAITKGTVCQGMALEIIHNPLKATCKACGVEFTFDIYNPKCTVCGSDNYDLMPDAELLLEEIEFQDKENK